MIPPVARRFVAGETAAEAIDHALRLDAQGIGTILNLLGEHYHDRAPADADAAAYRQLLRDLAATDAEPIVSVKPSQVGLSADESRFRENLRSIVATAAGDEVERTDGWRWGEPAVADGGARADGDGSVADDAGGADGPVDGFVWIDMEDATTTDATLDAFETLARAYPGRVGVCVQANLRRTRDDLARLADVPGKVRLVKGAYDEPEAIAYTDRAAVDEAYREDLRYAFEAFDGGIAVGSHDPTMIDLATSLHDEYGTPFEVQMLMGVREDAQRELAQQGYTVRQYAPYGTKWLSYFSRRVRERRENLAFALRAVAGL
jgi:proline dehydrogenase